MQRDDLEILRSFVEQALKRGWSPCNGAIQGAFVVLDPPCVRIAVASPSQHIDNDIFVDWLSPLHEKELAQAVWGSRLMGPDYQEAWRFHQHKLLDLLQTAPIKAYFEYLEVSRNDD